MDYGQFKGGFDYAITNHISMRKLSRDDSKVVTELLMDAVAMAGFGKPFTHDQAMEWLYDNIIRHSLDGYGRLHLSHRKTKSFVGVGGPYQFIIKNQKCIAIDCIIKPEYVGEDYVRELYDGVLTALYGGYGIPVVYALTLPDDNQKVAVLSSVGMVYDSSISQYDIDNIKRTYHIYSKLNPVLLPENQTKYDPELAKKFYKNRIK